MVTFTHDAPGTDEQLWQQWGGLADLEPLADVLPQHLVVLAAHPDDETLGAGGLIAHCAAAGTQVDVVVATTGEASHPRSPTTTPSQLAELRAHEVRAAVQALAPNARLHLMGLPDGRLAEHRERVVQKLSELLVDEAWLLAPWRSDAHPDHGAAGRAARIAATARIRLLEYPVWLWHWAVPDDVRVPWKRLRRFQLSVHDQRRKVEAMTTHASQVLPLSDQPGDEALLTPGVIAHFERDIEVFFDEGPTGERG